MIVTGSSDHVRRAWSRPTILLEFLLGKAPRRTSFLERDAPFAGLISGSAPSNPHKILQNIPWLRTLRAGVLRLGADDDA